MSQSLVLMIRHFGETTAGIYYRWSGYSDAALKEARGVVNCIYAEEDLSARALQLRLIRMVEENGGGVRGGGAEGDALEEDGLEVVGRVGGEDEGVGFPVCR